MVIKRLDRLSLNGFANSNRLAFTVKYNGELYCISDPLILDNNPEVVVVKEVNDEKELWRYYLENNISNYLDPFKLLMLVKDKPFIFNILPIRIRDVLERNISLDDNLLLELEEHVRELEEKHKDKAISMHITILDAIREYKEKEEKLKEHYPNISIKEIINDVTINKDNVLYIPSPKAISVIINKLLEESERKKEEKEWNEYKERRDKAIRAKDTRIEFGLEDREDISIIRLAIKDKDREEIEKIIAQIKKFLTRLSKRYAIALVSSNG